MDTQLIERSLRTRNAIVPPRWLTRLANLVAEAIQADEDLGPIGCHFHREPGTERSVWELTLFIATLPPAHEFDESNHDGLRFMLDLFRVWEVFSSIDNFYWQAQPMADDDDVGPHVGVEGTFEDHAVWLRVTVAPPAALRMC